MLPAIGEATMQHTVRANYDSEMHDQHLAVKKSDKIREKRPVEKTEDSSKPEMNLKQDDVAVIIDEAIRLAKTYSDDEAYAYINAVLDGYDKKYS